MMPNVMQGDTVFVLNKTDGRTFKYNSREYALNPGKRVPIPVEAAILWFGDPRSGPQVKANKLARGNVEYVPDRASEVRRLRIKYGAGTEGDETNFGGIKKLPDVAVETLDGEELTMVIHDPKGNSVAESKSTVQQSDDLLNLVNKLQSELKTLQVQTGMVAPETAADEAELPSDDDVVSAHLKGDVAVIPGPDDTTFASGLQF